MPRICVAVVGPGEDATPRATDDALAIGRLIAQRGWLTLTGGRDAGVMRAATRGTAEAGGISIGLLPGDGKTDVAPDLTVALPTGMGEARNAVLVNSADAVVACGINPGTASEVALALRAGKPTVLVRPSVDDAAFFVRLGRGVAPFVAATPQQAVAWIEERLYPPTAPPNTL